MSKENGFDNFGGMSRSPLRERKGEQTVNSFKAFVAKAKISNTGKGHLLRHHGGHGL